MTGFLLRLALRVRFLRFLAIGYLVDSRHYEAALDAAHHPDILAWYRALLTQLTLWTTEDDLVLQTKIVTVTVQMDQRELLTGVAIRLAVYNYVTEELAYPVYVLVDDSATLFKPTENWGESYREVGSTETVVSPESLTRYTLNKALESEVSRLQEANT